MSQLFAFNTAFFPPPSQIHTLTEMPQTGVIGVQGRLLQITVITRNDLFHENSHTCHFMLECGGQMPVELWVTALCNSFLTHYGSLFSVTPRLLLNSSHAGVKWTSECFCCCRAGRKRGQLPPLIMIMHNTRRCTYVGRRAGDNKRACRRTCQQRGVNTRSQHSLIVSVVPFEVL